MPFFSALTTTLAQSVMQIVASGPGRHCGSQRAMCASAGLNMQTTDVGLCRPLCATARARHFIGVPLDGHPKAEAFHRGGHREVALGPAQGEVLAGLQAQRSLAMSCVLAAGVLSIARCNRMASIVHVVKGQARDGVYSCMVHCGRAHPTQHAWSTPRTMSAARTSPIRGGCTTSYSAGPTYQPPECRATSVCPVRKTRSTASRMFTLPHAVLSWIQRPATP